ncbi:MICOS complex subunit MIC60-like [Tubulanus polymorphus]|uniref:MICOS complex subunit MIC60-like n=1 Tax=Tubulanus polymorphus TaxID=672921 RepID=UPI003DA32DEE
MLRVSGISTNLRRCSVISGSSSKSAQRWMNTESMKTPPQPETVKPPPPKPRKKKGLLSFTMKVIGVGAIGFTGIIGYAAYDMEFREKVEKNVPYSKQALEYAFEYMPSDFPSIRVPKIPGVSTTDNDVTKGLESIDKESVKKESIAFKESTSKPDEATKKPAVKVFRTDGKQITEPQKVETKKQEIKKDPSPPPVTLSEAERRIRDKEAEEAAENLAIEAIVDDLICSSKSTVQGALVAQNNAESHIKQHYELLKKAMEEENDDNQWKDVSKAFEEQILAVTNAERATNNARLNIEKLRTAIDEGRENKITRGNKILSAAQKNLNDLSYELEQSIARTRKAESSARLMHEFKDLVEQGKKQFQKELASITPDVKLGRKGKKLTEEELNSLIAHAHRRIEQLQKQLLKQQVLQEESIEMALQRQREEDELITEQKIKQELEKQRGLLQLEKQQWDEAAKSQFEAELRQQLSRQAAAHSDHLADVLRVQRKELHLQFEEKLRERLFEERIRFQNDVSGSIARLKGIETAVENRAEAEKLGRKASEMWLASMTLLNAIRLGRDGASSPDEKVKPLGNELMAVREAGNNHEFVNTVLDSIPDDAITRGVWTEETLTARFRKVKTIAKRVAMVTDNNKTIVRYALSYLQSLFIIDSVKAIDPDTDIDPVTVDTFTLLASAEKSINNNDLEQGVRFMSQLTGEARNVAADWIKEAILYLETKQAAHVLIGHASVNGVSSLV